MDETLPGQFLELSQACPTRRFTIEWREISQNHNAWCARLRRENECEP
jgi:hypothetical protein